MKKLILGLLVVATVLIATSCTTTQFENTVLPAAEQIVQGQKYTVLGRVTVTLSGSKFGYTNLFEEAKAKYPDCQDIVNVLVDKKSNGKYVMSALAIKYN